MVRCHRSKCHHYLTLRWSFKFEFCLTYTAWKVSKYRVFSGLYFPVFSPKYRKIRIRKNFVFGHFSRSDNCVFKWFQELFYLANTFWDLFFKKSLCFFVEISFKSSYFAIFKQLFINVESKIFAFLKKFIWVFSFPRLVLKGAILVITIIVFERNLNTRHWCRRNFVVWED